MLSAFLHGYLLSFGLILPLGPQNVFMFSQGANQPRLRRALPVVMTAVLAEVAQSGGGGHHLDQRGASGVQFGADGVQRDM